MKDFLWRFLLIGGFTLAGLLCIWPPGQKLKRGIDLSGGTILVYEVDRSNLPPGFNMDELISALKKRADPEGVKEIPIRKIGGNRIEIILTRDFCSCSPRFSPLAPRYLYRTPCLITMSTRCKSEM